VRRTPVPRVLADPGGGDGHLAAGVAEPDPDPVRAPARAQGPGPRGLALAAPGRGGVRGPARGLLALAGRRGPARAAGAAGAGGDDRTERVAVGPGTARHRAAAGHRPAARLRARRRRA